VRGKIALALGACWIVAACSTPRYGTPPSNASTAAHGMSATGWYDEGRVPPQGFLMTDQDALVGRNVEDKESSFVGTIAYVLYQPAAGDTTRYVAIANRSYNGYLVVPIAGLRITQDTVWVGKTRADLLAQRHYSLAELEEHYPPINMRQTVISPAPLPGVSTIPAAGAMPATAPPLMLALRGGAVGAPVYDVTSNYVGTLAAESVEPGTGAPRYAIITGPVIGPGYFIAVPANHAQYVNGRVMLDAPVASWQQMPRYQLAQVQQAYGALGVIR
jgi:hypothetical protein